MPIPSSRQVVNVLKRYAPPVTLAQLYIITIRHIHFLGPGLVSSVAYIDPGNWATDLSAGANYGYKLLFIVLLAGLAAAGIFHGVICEAWLICSPPVPLGPIGSHDNYIFTASNSEIDIGAQGKVSTAQSRATWALVDVVHPGGDRYYRNRSRRTARDGYCS